MAALVDWASLLFFFGSCVSYLVIIGAAAACIVTAWPAASHAATRRSRGQAARFAQGRLRCPRPAISSPPWLYLPGDAFSLVAARGGNGGWYRAAEGEHYARLALLMLLGFTACCLLPLSLLRSMDSLQPTSALAMVRRALTRAPTLLLT